MSLNNFNYQISWSDFLQRAERPPGVNEDAEIHIDFPQSYEYDITRKGVIITTLSVNINILSELCWVLSNQLSNTTLLSHEQGHFDITALGAREFYNGLVSMSAADLPTLKGRIKQLRTSVQQKINRANATYDTRTSNSQDTSQQQLWKQKIDAAKQNPAGTINDLPG